MHSPACDITYVKNVITDHNIHVVSSPVSGSAPGYQTLSTSSEGYGYSQNFENYDFYDPSGYQDYFDPYA